VDKENIACHSATPEQAIMKKLPSTMSWVSFTSLLRDNKGSPSELEAFVTELPCERLGLVQSPHDHAMAIAKAVWDATGYLFKPVIDLLCELYLTVVKL
jgi:hypothetical protein